jgi:hypothetical protein
MYVLLRMGFKSPDTTMRRVSLWLTRALLWWPRTARHQTWTGICDDRFLSLPREFEAAARATVFRERLLQLLGIRNGACPDVRVPMPVFKLTLRLEERGHRAEARAELRG